MPSYQIPQFLDSGDKIFLGMNVRQFAYALVGFFICVLVFNLFFPAIGNYAFVPIAPIALLTAYISLGKFNGRDSEIYILKGIIFVTKPRVHKYARAMDMTDINYQFSQLTYEVKNKELESHLTKQTAVSNDPLANFRGQNSSAKAARIRQIGKHVDDQFLNAAKSVVSKEIKIQRHRELLGQLSKNKIK
jgi:hypothetical protein